MCLHVHVGEEEFLHNKALPEFSLERGSDMVQKMSIFSYSEMCFGKECINWRSVTADLGKMAQFSMPWQPQTCLCQFLAFIWFWDLSSLEMRINFQQCHLNQFAHHHKYKSTHKSDWGPAQEYLGSCKTICNGTWTVFLLTQHTIYIQQDCLEYQSGIQSGIQIQKDRKRELRIKTRITMNEMMKYTH